MTELQDLIGLHILSGVDYEFEHCKQHIHDSYTNVINFVLDDVCYTAVEDDNDGYRSAMDKLFVSNYLPKQRFSVVVFAHMRENFSRERGILDFYDVKNGKLVLSVGTDNTEDYYPCFVDNFTPENMSINDDRNQF